jgi:hypothetical protein
VLLLLPFYFIFGGITFLFLAFREWAFNVFFFFSC